MGFDLENRIASNLLGPAALCGAAGLAPFSKTQVDN